MMTILIIAIIIFVMYIIFSNDENSKQSNTHTNKYNTDDVFRNEVSQINNKNIKVTITIGKPVNSYEADDSIIDVTGQSSKITSNITLIRYALGIPKWPMQYSYAYANINDTSFKQKEFYRIFKESFLNSIYFDLENNINYAFVLLDDLQNEYYNHKNLSKLESQFDTLGKCYPDTKSKANSFLIKKTEKDNGFELKKEYSNSNDNFYDEYWQPGDKYKTKLNLNVDEVNLLNKFTNPNDNFCSIEFCFLEVCKLYLIVFSDLTKNLIRNNKSLEEELSLMADIIARKDFRYRMGSQNYNYCIKKITTDEFYVHIFKKCDKAIREYYDIKGKRNTDTYFINSVYDSQFYNTVISKIDDSISSKISNINKPTEEIEIELNSYFTTRWRVKYDDITSNYDNDTSYFAKSINELLNFNIKNSSIQNIYFDASKFICRVDKELSIQFYLNYLYYDLKSPIIKNKKLTKYMLGNLFNSKEQLTNFEAIVKELVEDKDLNKALQLIPEIYKINRKKIQLNRKLTDEVIEQHSETAEPLNEYLKADFEEAKNTISYKGLEKRSKSVSKEYEVKKKKIQLNIASINEVQQKHSETVELLNEYLKDDLEDENNIIKLKETKNEEIHQSNFLSELTFTAIHATTLELFVKSNFSVSQTELEVFAKSKGVFKNQLIESINDICYDFLDDVLIEEDDDFYIINTDYFQKISIK
ncbi:tellurite resistance TerB C-terminal domain-containing protein [Flavobacterium sp. 7A]|uniref:tellurite resistance TerB C-terminal domain-containing protein n=1 Tax=Flavobacterium sp. 7A TaxID=2940571 RepID=UPI00222716EE|nr:tellurite resistance TerB C-terminal domain-containing protein [Flavobacterium sp. 7A]MCW2117943.1 hypothetical protein [Flavobacterium sp. 7A]